jgi:hypothetical protein
MDSSRDNMGANGNLKQHGSIGTVLSTSKNIFEFTGVESHSPLNLNSIAH